MRISRLIVIPAKAGNQGSSASALVLDPRFRGGDGGYHVATVTSDESKTGNTRVNRPGPVVLHKKADPGRQLRSTDDGKAKLPGDPIDGRGRGKKAFMEVPTKDKAPSLVYWT